MRQLLKNETILVGISALLITHLLFLPLAHDILMGATPTSQTSIAYFPALVGRYGQQVTIRAHIAESAAINKVTLVVENGDKPLRGAMPQIKQEGLVPVIVRANKETSIRAGAAANKSIKGRLAVGETMQVAGEKSGYYRGVSGSDVKGYVLKTDVDVVTTGSAYAVTLPATITSRATLTYHIEAEGANGLIAATTPVSMRLLTEKEIDLFLASYGGGVQQTAGAPIYKKPLFWAGMAALAGGAILLSGDNADDTPGETTVDVLVDWE